MLTYLTTLKHIKTLFDQFHPEIHGVLDPTEGLVKKLPEKRRWMNHDH